MRNKATSKKLTVLALLCALGLIVFMIEGLFPPLFFPGAKMGLSNIFTLFALLFYGLPEAILVTVARTVLGSLFAGNFSLLLYSLTAGLVSVCVSRLFLLVFPKISILCVSILSAVAHNLTQLAVYCLLTQTALLWGYSPYLILLGTVAGAIVGLSVHFLVKGIPTPFFERILSNPTKQKSEDLR